MLTTFLSGGHDIPAIGCVCGRSCKYIKLLRGCHTNILPRWLTVVMSFCGSPWVLLTSTSRYPLPPKLGVAPPPEIGKFIALDALG